MTFKDLQKVIESESGSTKAAESNQILRKLRDSVFWEWGIVEHRRRDRASGGKCCFNHIIGLLKKEGVEKPLFDYESLLYKAFLIPGYLNSSPTSTSHTRTPDNVMHPFKEKHLWVKKATGLGITEFMLRFMAWLCLKVCSCIY